MNKKKIQIEYSEKISLISKLNKFYYYDNNTKVTDKKYDQLKKEILELEKSTNFLNPINPPQKLLDLNHLKTSKK